MESDELERKAVDCAPQHPSYPERLNEILRAFTKLGMISFGGPIAHLGYLRAEFVSRRQWLSDQAYADVVALCQFLPGPASSQVVYALGSQRAGVLGGLLASICFTLPSAVLMILFAYGVAMVGDLSAQGWLHGLKLAAVAVVAQAVLGMGRNLCPDRARLSICISAAIFLLVIPGAWTQVGAIAAGALTGWLLYRQEELAPACELPASDRAHPLAAGALILFLGLLLLLPLVAQSTQSKTAAVFDSFYRSGSLVFGGGHVVLPLLRAELVPQGWINDAQFLAGYGVAQAVPGPLFTFAAYLGTAIFPGPGAWAGGLWCLLAIFLPAWLLVGGALPFWNRIRSRRWAQAGLKGANAAVVGVLLAALYMPVITESVFRSSDVAAAFGAFALLQWWRVPPWLVVTLMAGVGWLFL